MLRRQGNRRVAAALVAVVVCASAAVSAASAQSQRSSADTQWIVFSGLPRGFGVEQLFRVSTAGKGLKQLTNSKSPSEAPAFSPNGQRIAFARLGAGIFSMTIDGKGLRRLTTNGRDSYPAWSPDGKQIAFLRPSAKGWNVYVMSASGAGERRLPKAPAAGRPSWTPRGLVIPTEGDLARINPGTGGVQKLFGAFIDASIGMSSTAVASDLSNTTFIGSRPPNPGDKDCGEGVPCPHFALYIQNLRTLKAPKILAKDAGPGSFSHDGKIVAFVVRNRLVLRPIAKGTSKPVATGKVVPTTSAPPVWQPR